MFTADDFQYALENTRVLLAPQRQIDTFGSTRFRFHLLTESMDRTDEVRVREGTVHAERPQLVTPAHHAELLLDNFGEKARACAEWLQRPGSPLGAVLRYGFRFRRTEIREHIIRDSVEAVGTRLCDEVTAGHGDEPLRAVIQGVDDAWEVCLLKFTMDLVQGSAATNVGDLRRRGWL